MPVNNSTLNKNLFDLLRSKGYDPISLNSKGDPSEDIEEADVFRFNYVSPEGEKVGTGWATIEGKELVIYTNRDLIKAPKFEELAMFMKDWARRKLLGFKVTNKDFLVHDMKKRTVMKNKEDQLNEGYYALGKKASYNDSVPTVKMIIQHTRNLEEGEQRFRNIAKIFVENANGERFLLPTNRPGLARVYARHIAEGGTPYDDRAKHITTLVEEYTQMAGFVRATRNGQFNESAQRLVNEGLNHYSNLRETLTRMASHRGYNKYFESYTPVLNEETDDETSLNELFVQETLDPRIESVMPILKRLSKNITEMSEVNELAEWAESITEVEDETTKTLAEPAEEMLDERNIENKKMKNRVASRVGASTDLYGKDVGVDKYDHQPSFTTGTHSREVGRSVMKDPKISSSQVSKLLKKNSDPDMFSDIKEAPGAETLKHNQDTEKSNLKAFDLEEGFSPSQEVADQIIDSLGGESELSSDDIYRAVEEYQGMMDSPHKLDVDEVVQIVMDRMNVSDEVDEAFRYYYPGATKPAIMKKAKKFIHGKKGFEEDVEEGLDANQKRAGQLGPTEKVGKNEKNLRGKLVGASESINYDEDQKLFDQIMKLAGK